MATRREESARAAAEAFGAARWFADPYAMIRDDDIDIITVAVKVPAHKDLVLAALEAGKAVYSESPLGATLAEAEEMAAAAGTLHTAIGLQGRHNPAVRRAAELIATGAIGRPLSARFDERTFGFGPQSPSAYDYFNKAASGANILTITTGHVLDVVEAVLGDIREVDARIEILWPQIEIVDTGATSTREVADHVDLIAKTASGAPVSAQVLANTSPQDVKSVFEVLGSEGWLRLSGLGVGAVQVGNLTLTSSASFAPPDAPVAPGAGSQLDGMWSGDAPVNVGEVYASLARDIAAGTFRTPGFTHAVHNSRLVAAVERAARTGVRQRPFA